MLAVQEKSKLNIPSHADKWNYIVIIMIELIAIIMVLVIEVIIEMIVV